MLRLIKLILISSLCSLIFENIYAQSNMNLDIFEKEDGQYLLISQKNNELDSLMNFHFPVEIVDEKFFDNGCGLVIKFPNGFFFQIFEFDSSNKLEISTNLILPVNEKMFKNYRMCHDCVDYEILDKNHVFEIVEGSRSLLNVEEVKGRYRLMLEQSIDK